MSSPQIPDDAAPSRWPGATRTLVLDAEVRRLMRLSVQAEQLMEHAFRDDDLTRATRYYRLCEAACTACLHLLKSD